MTKTELAQSIYKVSHLTGEFKLRSGKVSKEYFDKYQFESRPEILTDIVDFMTPLVPKGTDLLGALEMGGIPLATVVSLRARIPVVFLRKSAKSYGTCKFAEGPDVKGKKICLIEDVITTGGQVVATTKMLRDAGAIVTSVVCVIDRSEGETQALKDAGLKMKSVLTMAEIKEAVGEQIEQAEKQAKKTKKSTPAQK
jgi:orotate phosphoribosyltransferase